MLSLNFGGNPQSAKHRCFRIWLRTIRLLPAILVVVGFHAFTIARHLVNMLTHKLIANEVLFSDACLREQLVTTVTSDTKR